MKNGSDMLAPGVPGGSQSQLKKLLSLLLAGVLVIGMTCCLVGGGIWVYSAAQGGVAGLPGRVCAGATMLPHLRVGVGWCSPISSYLPSLMLSPYAVCVDVPYQLISLFPKLAGEVLFPP